MQAAHEPGREPEQKHAPALAAFEVGWIFLMFFLFAGSLPPDVGESHYLVKAKHYWEPSWCAGDLFLESRDAHAVFYWVFGWVTKFCSLSATAWIGRSVTWLLLAWSWQRLSWAVMPRPLVSLLSAGLFLALLRHGHLAGEWVIGGVEAKSFAYVLVFLALEAMVYGWWRRAIVFAGAAGAFHVLVGGWTVVAIAIAWLTSGRERPAWQSLVPAAALGLVLSLPGLIPAIVLNMGMPKDVTREAARIYVFERLNHHLVYAEFEAWNVARFQFLVLAWGAAAWLLRRNQGLARLQRVVCGTVVIAICGVAIDQFFVHQADWFGQSAVEYERSAAGLLRYYWFRMSDSLVPVGMALAIVAELPRLESSRPVWGTWLRVAAIVLAAANLGEVFYSRAHRPIPPAILQSRPAEIPRIERWFPDWVKVCDWIAVHTPADAVFLTPREQQTFKWYAGRAEVVTWKDVPQDARGLIEWKQRMDEIHPRDRTHHARDLAAFSDAELISVARKYGATYILLDKTKAKRRIGMPRIYPTADEANASFEIHVVEPQRP